MARKFGRSIRCFAHGLRRDCLNRTSPCRPASSHPPLDHSKSTHVLFKRINSNICLSALDHARRARRRCRKRWKRGPLGGECWAGPVQGQDAQLRARFRFVPAAAHAPHEQVHNVRFKLSTNSPLERPDESLQKHVAQYATPPSSSSILQRMRGKRRGKRFMCFCGCCCAAYDFCLLCSRHGAVFLCSSFLFGWVF